MMILAPVALLAISMSLLPNVLGAPYCPPPKICQIMSELGSSIDGTSKLGKIINNSGHTLDDFLELFCNTDTTDETATAAVAPSTSSQASQPIQTDPNLIAAPSPTEVTTTAEATPTGSPTAGNNEGACEEDENEAEAEHEYEHDEDDEDGEDDEDFEDCEEEDAVATTTTTSPAASVSASDVANTDPVTHPSKTTITASSSPAEVTSSSDDHSNTTPPSISAEVVSADESTSGSEIKMYLDAHNKVRSGIAQDLVWDEGLAASAAESASLCKLEHTQSGQNIAAATGNFGPTEAIASWATEEATFQAGNIQAAGHYTQVIWKGTTRVGCGKATCEPGEIFEKKYGKSTLIFCNYDPAGNVQGQYEENT